MAVLEARISQLEAKVEEHTRGIGELRELIRNLDAKVDRQFAMLDQKLSRHFLWLAGFQLTTLLAVIGFLSR